MPAPISAIVVGFGHLGFFHAQKYQSLDGVTLTAVIDPRCEQDLEKNLRKLTKPVRHFLSLEHFFASVSSGEIPKPDLASVASTTDAHVELGLELVKRGVHLLVEKPLAMSSNEALRLVEAAEKNQLILATGQVERHRAVEVVHSTKGKPLFIECHRLSPFPARSTDIDVIFDLMIHDIDLMLALVDSKITAISAAGFPVLTSKIDIANSRFEFENGCVVNLTSSRISMTRVRKFRIFSGDSYVSLDLASGVYEQYVKAANEPDLSKAILHKEGKLESEDALREEILDFVSAVREKRSPLVSGRDGLRAIEVAEKVVLDVERRLKQVQQRISP